jgi:hypothetical protein
MTTPAAESQHVSWFVIVLITLIPSLATIAAYLFVKRLMKLKIEGTTQRTFGPTIENPTAAVLMSPEFIDHPPRKLKDVPPGEEVYIAVTYVSVNEKGQTFVDLEAPTSMERESIGVKVKRADGGFWLWMFKPGSISFLFTSRPLVFGSYAPVVKIMEAQ